MSQRERTSGSLLIFAAGNVSRKCGRSEAVYILSIGDGCRLHAGYVIQNEIRKKRINKCVDAFCCSENTGLNRKR